MGTTFDTEQELFGNAMKVLNTILREELESVFDEWLRRLDACIERDGKHIERDQVNKYFLILMSLTDVLMLNFSGVACIERI
jgi:hypothetical protein